MEFRNSLNFVLCSFIIYLCIAWVPLAYKIFVTVSGILVGIRFAEWLMTNSRQYVLHKKVSQKNKAILITGCDTGFGHALAKRMYNLGYTVFAACLLPDGDGAKTLQNNEKMKVLQMDVTDDLSIQNAKEIVTDNLGQNVLWAVINNAGIAQIGEIDWASFEDIQKAYDVNTAGILRVTKAFLPFLKESKGRIVNLTSLAGRKPFPGYSGYAMSKSASISMTSGLGIELAKWGIKAISIEPGFYTTHITSLEHLNALADKVWKAVPDHIKDEYGEDYIEYFKEKINFTTKLFHNPNTYEVVDCLEDAITAEEPISVYYPCKLQHRIIFWLLYSLPSEWTDLCLKLVYGRGMKIPALILKRKEE